MRIPDRYAMAADMRKEYLEAGRQERRQILEAFCRATRYHPKHAAAVLSGRQQRRAQAVRAPRRRRYGKRFRDVLAVLWEASGYVCTERLQPWMPELLRLLERHNQMAVDDETRALILSASRGTVERNLHELRCDEVGKRMVQTKPGTLLRRQIPVIVGQWKEQDEPGYVEVDLVSHSGEHAVGTFLNTLSVVDVCTGWSERVPIMGKTQEAVEEAMGRIEFLLPFQLKGIHPDNGSEFINHLMMRWCRDHEVIFSRGRPYRKNDNPHVEQKNWTLVRRLVGYERFDRLEEQVWLEALYTELVRPFANCFQPVMKLAGKEHVDGHTRRRYDIPQTPLQRVIDAEAGDTHKVACLLDFYNSTSPLTLKRRLDRELASRPFVEDAASA